MSTNEWSKLKKVIVGIADNAKIPTIEKSVRTVNYAHLDDISNIKVGQYPKQIIDEANEDLEIFVDFLKSESVEVVRPTATDCAYYNYCPRDSVFVHGDRTIATPMPIRQRKNEWKAFSHHLKDPIDLSSDMPDSLYNLECVGNKDVLALNETSPAFDAANVIRANDHALYLVSNSGNKLGAKILENAYPELTINLLEGVYSYMHIDSTVAFLREGLMLLNPERIKSKDVLPLPFRNWDAIWCPGPTDIGYYGNYNNASRWINMNLFSINPNLVVLEKNQHSLRLELEKYNIDCAMLPTRHQRTLGGGFHCVTLDVEREMD